MFKRQHDLAPARERRTKTYRGVFATASFLASVRQRACWTHDERRVITRLTDGQSYWKVENGQDLHL